MDLRQVMAQKRFVIVGDTLNPEKYAFRITNRMRECGYDVACVGCELDSINAVEGDIDVIDLCINPKRGLEIMRACEKPFKCIVIQPGAESSALMAYLDEQKLPYIESCLLVGLRTYVD